MAGIQQRTYKKTRRPVLCMSYYEEWKHTQHFQCKLAHHKFEGVMVSARLLAVMKVKKNRIYASCLKETIISYHQCILGPAYSLQQWIVTVKTLHTNEYNLILTHCVEG